MTTARGMAVTVHPARAAWIAVVCVLAAGGGASPARAALGGDVSSVQADQVWLTGARRHATMAPSAQAAPTATPIQVHEITTADGSSVREYMTDAGIVFAVSWSTHFKPDLPALFGLHASTYADAASQAMRTPGIKRQVMLERGDLVVQSGVHFNHFVGKAYVKSLVPADVHVDQLR